MGGRIENELAAGESLTKVIVRGAFERESHALGEECSETLSGRSGEFETDRAVRQALGTIPAGDLAPPHRTPGAMHVADGQLYFDRRLILDAVFFLVDLLII